MSSQDTESARIPVINLSSGSAEEHAELAAELVDAASKHGFIFVTGDEDALGSPGEVTSMFELV